MLSRVLPQWPCGPLTPRSVCIMTCVAAPFAVAAGLYGAVQLLTWLLEALFAA